jgi:copper oxidase (laccase) domain-containing protein
MSEIIFKKVLPVGKLTVYNSIPSLENLVAIHQTHSADIVEYKGSDISTLKADGILVMNENIVNKSFAIKTADCMPVVFIGTKGICIIHAGWVGLRDKILINQEIKKISPYFCYIAPSISVDSFEVQEDFKLNFPNSPYFVQNKDYISFNLIKEATQQIKNNFPTIEIENSAECTYKSHKYNSFRRDKTSERNWNIFSI